MPGMLPDREWTTMVIGGGKRRIVVVIGHRASLAPVVDDPFFEDMSEFEEEFEEPDEWT
ncbi:MAG TPA: hypothetical protein VMV92_12245 [Streptosporangiaceae bacterium]|nr:hypothetical protein [Streptosporangiaceae bacterium]